MVKHAGHEDTPHSACLRRVLPLFQPRATEQPGSAYLPANPEAGPCAVQQAPKSGCPRSRPGEG
jgi:hypothetical protein